MPSRSEDEFRQVILKFFLQFGNKEVLEGFENPYELDIFEHEFVDSFSISSLIAVVEEHFNITFNPDQLNSDQIRTIGGMSKLAYNMVDHNESV